jgi:hypothetical protein
MLRLLLRPFAQKTSVKQCLLRRYDFQRGSVSPHVFNVRCSISSLLQNGLKRTKTDQNGVRTGTATPRVISSQLELSRPISSFNPRRPAIASNSLSCTCSNSQPVSSLLHSSQPISTEFNFFLLPDHAIELPPGTIFVEGVFAQEQ